MTIYRVTSISRTARPLVQQFQSIPRAPSFLPLPPHHHSHPPNIVLSRRHPIHRFKHSYYRPSTRTPGVSGSSSPLPTLDASPLLDPTLYIKKTASSNTLACGTESAKRLLRGQSDIRDWILDDGLVVKFSLKGHGIPFQLLQDHVDCAWGVLEGVGYGLGCDIAECSVRNGTAPGELGFEWIRIRTSDGQNGSYPWPIHQRDPSIHDDLQHGMELYLTVMSRLSTVFGAVLKEDTPNNPGRNRIKCQHKYWSVELKRGYMYPPGVTANSGRGGGWTSPPIVELIQSERDTIDGGSTSENSEVPSFVRITLQGIPSSFWKEDKSSDMTPVSMIFEACFQQVSS